MREPEMVYFKWSEFQFISCICIFFWHRLCRKWGWFLALVSIKGGKGPELLRRWVGWGGWGRCVGDRLGHAAPTRGFVVTQWSRGSWQGRPCRLSEKHTWVKANRNINVRNWHLFLRPLFRFFFFFSQLTSSVFLAIKKYPVLTLWDITWGGYDNERRLL